MNSKFNSSLDQKTDQDSGRKIFADCRLQVVEKVEGERGKYGVGMDMGMGMGMDGGT